MTEENRDQLPQLLEHAFNALTINVLTLLTLLEDSFPDDPKTFLKFKKDLKDKINRNVDGIFNKK